MQNLVADRNGSLELRIWRQRIIHENLASSHVKYWMNEWKEIESDPLEWRHSDAKVHLGLL